METLPVFFPLTFFVSDYLATAMVFVVLLRRREKEKKNIRHLSLFVDFSCEPIIDAVRLMIKKLNAQGAV